MTPTPEIVHPDRTVLEADFELCTHENERLRLELAVLRAQIDEKDRVNGKLKLELKIYREKLSALAAESDSLRKRLQQK